MLSLYTNKIMRTMKSNVRIALTSIKDERNALEIRKERKRKREREREKGNDFRLIYFEREPPRVID